MKKAISLLLALSLLFSLFVVASPMSTAAEGSSAVPVFQDVKESDWFYEYVTLAAEKGLVNGITTTTFAPDNNITRAQFATILYRQLGSPSVDGLNNPFTDLVDNWYKNAVIYMSHIGVINGLTKTTFGPAKNITREQMVTMLYRLNNDNGASYENSTVNFSDGASVSSWALDAMNWSIAEGIINGTNKGLLLPQGNATRAQAAKVICLNFGLSREELTLTFWHACNETESSVAVMRQILDEFESKYPGITVDYKTLNWNDDPHSQFEAAIDSGECADLLVLGSPLDFQLADEGKLLPLDDLLSETVLNDVYDMLKEQSTYYGSKNEDMYGKIYALPLYGAARGLVYNKEIFDFFGVEYPTEAMTHAELLELAKKLTGEMNGTYVSGYGTRATTSEQYLQFAWNYGAQIIDPYTMTAATDSPEWKQGIEDYLAFYEAGVVPEGALSMNGLDLLNMFMNGEIAMFVTSYEYVDTLLEDPTSSWSEKIGVAPMAGETYSTSWCGADVMAIPATTEHPHETALLMEHLLSAKAQAAYAEAEGFFPVTASGAAEPYFANDPFRSAFAQTMATGHYFDSHGIPGIGTALKNNLQMLLTGEYTIDEYQTELTKAINEKIAGIFDDFEENTDHDNGGEGSDTVTLRFWHAAYDDPTSAAIMQLLLDKFELLNPGITVDYTVIPWEHDPHTQFSTTIKGDDCADLLVMGSPNNFYFANDGELYPLNALLSQEVLDDLPKAVIDQNIYMGSANADMYGQLMTLPLYNSTYALMYNKEIFDYFGVEYPTESMTHAELLDLAKKVTGEMYGSQVYGYGTRANTASQYMQFVWNYGAQVIDPYTMTAGTDSAAWRQGILDYAAFYEAGVVHEDSSFMSGIDLLELFTTGKIAMMVGPYDYATTIVANTYWQDRLGVAPMAGEIYSTGYCGADYLAVPYNTHHPEETALLLNYLLSTEAQVTYCKGIGYFPTVKSAIADPYFAEDPILAEFAKAVEGGHYFDTYGVSGLGTLLKDHLQRYLAGMITIDEYQALLTEEINANIQELYN